jgi:hypothetical protein
MSRGIKLISDAGNAGNKIADTIQKVVTDNNQQITVDVTRTIQSDPSQDIDQAVMTGSPSGGEGGAVTRPIPWTGSGVACFQVSPTNQSSALPNHPCKKVALRSKFNNNGCGPIYFAVNGPAGITTYPLENGDQFPFEMPVSNTNLITIICPTQDAVLCVAAF